MRATSTLSRVLLAAPLALLLVATSCAETPAPVVSAAAAPDLFVSIDFPGGVPSFGELARARVTIANGTAFAVMLRGVEIPGQLPELETWVISRGGRLREERQRDRMHHDPSVPGETGPVFVRGLILPGEAYTVDRYLRLREPSFDVVLHTSRFDLGLLRDVVLFRSPDADRGLQRAYAGGSITSVGRYRRLEPSSPEREVLAPLVHELSIARQHFRVDTLVSGEDPAAAVLAVLSDLDGVQHDGEVSQWTSGPAWLVRSPRDHRMRVLFEDGSREDLRGVDFDVFDLADLSALDDLDILFEDRVVAAQRESNARAAKLEAELERAESAVAVVETSGDLDPDGPEEASEEALPGRESAAPVEEAASDPGALDDALDDEPDVGGDHLVEVAPERFLSVLIAASQRGLRLRVDWVDSRAEVRDLCIRGR